jgi:hypothetical protein
MNADREHVGFEELNDYVDDRLDRQTADRVSEHLNRCVSCRSEHEKLSEFLSVASAVRTSVDPGEDLWTEVRRAIESRKEVALPASHHAPDGRSNQKHVRVSPMFLAAAAVLLIVLSSGITTVVLRRSTAVALVQPIASRSSAVLPASFQATESEYAKTIDELRIAVDAQRGNLSPETVRTVDHSLAVVDSAIAEARAALIADPNNRTLVDLLASSYQRKLDLLRRTSELSSKT